MKNKSRPPGVHFVYATAPTPRAARSLARLAVGRRLAACANVLPEIDSLFWWGGKSEKAKEAGLILKTASDRIPELLRVLREAHPYDCPCLVHWELAGGHPGFLRWVIAETRANALGTDQPRRRTCRTPRKASSARSR
jgi:periplasmic divalent cation tolerance protein